MSSLNKALLLALIVSTGAFASHQNSHSDTGITITAEDIAAARQKIAEFGIRATNTVKAGAISTLEAIKGLDTVSFADVRKAAMAQFENAKSNLKAFPAAFEQSADNALDYIKANKADTALTAFIVVLLAKCLYDINCDSHKYEPQPYYAEGNGSETTVVYYR